MNIRTFAFTVFAGLVMAASSFAMGPAESASKGSSARGNGPELSVKRIVLFSSGVGYFERAGQVTGNEVVELSFLRSNVNDLLQSLVVHDGGGGKVLSVDYSSQDPLARALHSFPIDLSDSPGVATILSRARGATITITSPLPLRGEVLGLERRSTAEGEKLFLNLLTSNGTIRSVDMAAVDGLRFKDVRLQANLTDALALIAANRSTDTKRFAIRFAGSGTRPVSLSYIIETPVWKTSYRLSIQRDKPSFLQGWAIVDNPTDEDWNGVTLDLVSGQPISFQMDLNQAVYNRRPVLPVPLPPSVRPQTYRSGMSAAEPPAEAAPAPMASRAARPSAKSAAPYSELAAPNAGAGSSFSLSDGVESAATAAEAGQFFQYAIKDPVTLPRHQSAMVPIVNQEIEGTPVSIYNQSVLASHPLSGLELKNSSGLHLMAGPITVFDEGVYAGDAQINDLPPDATRLISYAVDLKTDIVTRGSNTPEAITSGKIVHGSMIVTRRLERTKTYEVSTTAADPRTVLIEQPISSGWKLVEPSKPKEETQSLYRFAVVTNPAKGGRASLTVREQRTVSQSVVLSNLDSRTILFYIGQREISNRVKSALSRLNELKRVLSDLTSQRSTVQASVDRIHREQERIRSNMRVLQTDSSLYKRYATTLGQQEDQLTASMTKIEDLTGQIEAAKKRIETYLGSLETVE